MFLFGVLVWIASHPTFVESESEEPPLPQGRRTVARIPWGVESELRIAVTRFDNGREMIDVRIYRDERAPLLDAAPRDDPGSHRSGVGRGVAGAAGECRALTAP
jgi:hypothetical protein